MTAKVAIVVLVIAACIIQGHQMATRAVTRAAVTRAVTRAAETRAADTRAVTRAAVTRAVTRAATRSLDNAEQKRWEWKWKITTQDIRDKLGRLFRKGRDAEEGAVDLSCVEDLVSGLDEETLDELLSGVDEATLNDIASVLDESTLDEILSSLGEDAPTAKRSLKDWLKKLFRKGRDAEDDAALACLEILLSGLDDATVDELLSGVDEPTLDGILSDLAGTD